MVELHCRKGTSTIIVPEDREQSMKKNGWTIEYRAPRVETDAQAMDAAEKGWVVSIGTGNFFHYNLTIDGSMTRSEMREKIRAFRRALSAYFKLFYLVKR